ncbi:hypothetical protein SHAb15599_00179 [Acinetobacter phage SH-Ab 15599]|nr:hypothetical protein SHAb15599_00179 [Acinetobacter phage SH-Ab 15599]
MSLTVAIDVDMTVVDVLQPWLKWMGVNHPEDYIRPQYQSIDGHYNKHLNELYGVNEDKINDFWSNADLYDHLDPMSGSQEYVEWLRRNNIDFYFLSVCYPGHFTSKFNFLKKHFGQDVKLIDANVCKSKYQYHLLVDDNPKVLQDVANSGIPAMLIQTNQITPKEHKLLSSGPQSAWIQHVDGFQEIIDQTQKAKRILA